MNQPISFTWDQQSAAAALKAGSAAGISETGAYEGDITSAVYEFGKDGSQSQALVLSLDADGQKANFLRINFLGRDGSQTFGMGLIAAIMWVAQVKNAQAQQRQGQNGPEWFLPALEGKRVGLFLQKLLITKQDGSDSYKFEVRHVFQPGSRLTYKEFTEKTPAEAIAALERTMKDKDDRKPHDSSRGGWGAHSNNNGGWGNNQTDPNSVPDSRLQQANRQVSQSNQHPDFDDDIPF
ncbi:hypothetical protein HCH39_05640 [Enterobacter kobei]|uniref:hypothetical protein n=1 Tax=Enterobacter kobei TaxID=208224 RepID=UPI001C8BF641|nr:hypothetical protein [Enterobacter kobei]ELE9727505.1 hypothetical protein [Enterobacter kobei]MBX8889188.1 hypothetical protein [Enterobacter kobei]